MPTAQHLRAQIEASLARKIPSALSPPPRVAAPVTPTGVREIDALLRGGLPVGAISEIVGPECSGRTSLALSLVANMTHAGKVCAWIDVSDAFHPESAAAVGVDLTRLLWVRCGVVAAPSPQSTVRKQRLVEKAVKIKPGLPPTGGGHPRMEANGLSKAVSDLLGTAAILPRCSEPIHKPRPLRQEYPPLERDPKQLPALSQKNKKPWSRLEQALRVMDLLLQAGGFSCLVLDMGSLSAEYAVRVPLATWFRFRAAAERLQANVLLLTQHACSRNSAGLVLRLEPGSVLNQHSTIFTGLEHRFTLERQRFTQSPGNVVPMRKQPQSVQTAQWQMAWTGNR